MRISDWSSDVCSSDLPVQGRRPAATEWPAVSVARPATDRPGRARAAPPTSDPGSSASRGCRAAYCRRLSRQRDLSAMPACAQPLQQAWPEVGTSVGTKYPAAHADEFQANLADPFLMQFPYEDRKSTRLNSSH